MLGPLCEGIPLYLPIHDQKEGFVFGVVRTFANLVHWPCLHLVASLPFGFISLGRPLATATCRIPDWPVDRDASSMVDAEDWYQRDWRDNPRLGFVDKTWPLICTAIGVGTGIYILYLIERSLG